ncbi:MAG: TonB-dependent receptor family protein [Planctomycetaceae bacterium]
MRLATLALLTATIPVLADDALERAVESYLAAVPDAPAGKESELPPVFVTGRIWGAGGVPEVPLTMVGSRDVFSPVAIRRSGAREINDLVRKLPAVSTRPYNGGEAAAPRISIRGLPDDGLTEYLLVLVDGVPANPVPYGWTALSFLPLTIDRIHAIDLWRGAHAVRYSPNTVAGVLNLVTPPVPREATLDLRTTVGSSNFLGTLVSGGGASGAWSALFSTVARSGDGIREEGEFIQHELALKLRHDAGPGRWTAVSLLHMKGEHKAPGGLTTDQFDADRFGNARPSNRFDGYRFVLDAVDHRPLGEDGWIESYFAFSETGRRLHAQRPHFGTPTSFRDWKDESTWAHVGMRALSVAEALGLEHEIHWGVRLHGEWLPHYTIVSTPMPFGSGPPVTIQDSRYRLSAVSLHADDTMRPTVRLTVTVGVRLEWIPEARGEDPLLGPARFDETFFALLPGAGASYALTDHLALFANAHRSFRAPQIWGFLFTGAPQQVDFELGTSIEAGSRVKGWKGFSGSLTGWRVDFDNVGNFDTGVYENLGRIVAQGFDLVLEWEAGRQVQALERLRVYLS